MPEFIEEPERQCSPVGGHTTWHSEFQVKIRFEGTHSAFQDVWVAPCFALQILHSLLGCNSNSRHTTIDQAHILNDIFLANLDPHRSIYDGDIIILSLSLFE